MNPDKHPEVKSETDYLKEVPTPYQEMAINSITKVCLIAGLFDLESDCGAIESINSAIAPSLKSSTKPYLVEIASLIRAQRTDVTLAWS